MTAKLENVVIAAGDCTLDLLPALGGKIGSLRVGPHQLLQAPLSPYAARTRTMAFSASDASGWDECLPSVAACSIQTETGPVTIPDHGDLWRIPWEVLTASSDSATLRATCFSLPLELTRSVLLTEVASGWRLSLLYTLVNVGNVPVPWAWSAHPLFATQPGDRIQLPASVTHLRLEGSGGGRLAANKRNGDLSHSGQFVQWPVAALANGLEDDLSIAKSSSSGAGDKLFAGPILSTEEGWCALLRSGIGLRLTVRFDPAATPYLGLWLCYGGWPEGQGPKQVCVALEPTTAPADSIPISPIPPAPDMRDQPVNGYRTLAPGETFSWPIELEIDRILNRIEANPA